MRYIVGEAGAKVGCSASKAILFSLPNEQSYTATVCLMVNVAFTCGRRLCCLALALPMKAVTADRVVLVHRGWAEIFFAFI